MILLLENKNYGNKFFPIFGKNLTLSDHIETSSRPIFPDEASFEAAFKEYYTPLYRVVYPVIKNRDTTEDVVQDLFVRLWNKRSSLTISGHIKPYLYRAAMNAAFDHIEKYKREVQLNDNMNEKFSSANGAEESISQTETETYIARAMDKLPPACRTVFVLSREEEMSYKEIADSLDISVKTVENQIGKALKILREELKPYIKDMIKLFILYFSLF